MVLQLPRELLAGGLSGAATRMMVAPLDVAKIRMQLQSEPIQQRGGGRYTGLAQLTRNLFAEEGVRAFYRGNVPAVALYTTWTALNFYIVERVTETKSETPRWLAGLVSGGLASGVATVFTYPFDLLRTRFAAQGMPKQHLTIQSMLKAQLRTAGVPGLFQGLGPAVIAIAPYSESVTS